VSEGETVSGATGDKSLVTGNVVAKRCQRGTGCRLNDTVGVMQKVDDQVELEARLSKYDLRRRTVTCIPPPN